MNRVYYNKLIRDRIPEKIAAKQQTYHVRQIVDDQEFEHELLKKIVEEAGSLTRARTRDEFLREYADLAIVLDTLTTQLDISEAELNLALKENLEKKGGFTERYFLDWSEASDYVSNESPQGIAPTTQ